MWGFSRINGQTGKTAGLSANKPEIDFLEKCGDVVEGQIREDRARQSFPACPCFDPKTNLEERIPERNNFHPRDSANAEGWRSRQSAFDIVENLSSAR